MEKNETIEGNKLIAEFMGFVKDVDSPWYRGFDFMIHHEKSCHEEQLKFHQSWDWLMPVVEKIIEIDIIPAPNWSGYRIEIVPRGYVKISGFPMPPIMRNVSIDGSLINAVYNACVDFVKWHNQQLTTK